MGNKDVVFLQLFLAPSIKVTLEIRVKEEIGNSLWVQMASNWASLSAELAAPPPHTPSYSPSSLEPIQTPTAFSTYTHLALPPPHPSITPTAFPSRPPPNHHPPSLPRVIEYTLHSPILSDEYLHVRVIARETPAHPCRKTPAHPYCKTSSPCCNRLQPTLVATDSNSPLLQQTPTHPCCNRLQLTLVATDSNSPLLQQTPTHPCCNRLQLTLVATDSNSPLLQQTPTHPCCNRLQLTPIQTILVLSTP
ncbi:putative uncharacterized protein DDB_G0290521 [Palaemon carinicauda]|uniref:putative uncharacterized protein DDB_G0290521 n=1 Tax=Palaemon carinicauda TaxID=392227 RepID=UPI0035B5BFD6